MQFLKLAVTVLAIASCAANIEVVPDETPTGADNVITLETTLAPKCMLETRALTDPGDGSLKAAWKVGEELLMVYLSGNDYAEAKATVTKVDANGKATISVDLVDPKSGEFKIAYPYVNYHYDPNDPGKNIFLDQLGSLEDVSANYDMADGLGNLVVDGNVATVPEGISLDRQVSIWKFTLKAGGSDITSSVTSLVLNIGDANYNVSPSGLSAIFVAFFPLENKTVKVTATTSSGTYSKSKEGVTLEVGKLYVSEGLELEAEAATTTFTYTSSEKVTAFDNLENFIGATAVASNTFSEGAGTVVYEGTVTEIAEYAFYYDQPAKNSMTAITIPPSVTILGKGALSGGKKLVKVAFSGISKLQTIGASAFRSSKALESFDVPASVLVIEDGAFSGCTALASVTFQPNSSLTTIGGGAFGDCSALTSISLPESLTTLGSRKTEPYEYENGACFWFTGLTSFTLPKNVTTIYGGGHLGSCPITSLTVAPGNTKYDSRNGSNAIYETATDKLVIGCHISTVPDGVKTIGCEAFWAEEQPFSLELPESVTTFENRAFHLARGLTTLNIPSGITKIDAETFMGCSSVTDVYCAIDDPATLTWEGSDWSFNDMTPRATKFHVSNPSAWIAKFPDANVTFVGNEVNLGSLSANYTANGGDLLTGTLNPSYRLIIPDGGSVILKDVTIEYGSIDGAAITCEGNATISLEGTNSVTVPAGADPMSGYPAILAGGPGTKMTIGGSGTLTAIGGYIAAGIGCYNDSYVNQPGPAPGYTCGTIQIDGGTIYAYSGNNQALGDGAEVGIGAVCGGISADGCEGIIINGGTVTAKGAAGGIGGSGGTTVGDIEIKGGTVTAQGEEGPGIGICSIGTCGNITISRGTVTAIGGLSSAGIGTGCGIDAEHPSVCGNIAITGQYATVTAIGDECGIGTGYAGKCGNITITAGTVVAVSSSTGTVDQNDGTGAGIGAGGAGSCGDILIKGGTIIAKGGNQAAGVGSSSGGSSHYESLTIDSVYFPTYNELASLTATRGSSEAQPIGRGANDTVSPDPVFTSKVKKDEAGSTDDTWIFKVN